MHCILQRPSAVPLTCIRPSVIDNALLLLLKLLELVALLLVDNHRDGVVVLQGGAQLVVSVDVHVLAYRLEFLIVLLLFQATVGAVYPLCKVTSCSRKSGLCKWSGLDFNLNLIHILPNFWHSLVAMMLSFASCIVVP